MAPGSERGNGAARGCDDATSPLAPRADCRGPPSPRGGQGSPDSGSWRDRDDGSGADDERHGGRDGGTEARDGALAEACGAAGLGSRGDGGRARRLRRLRRRVGAGPSRRAYGRLRRGLRAGGRPHARACGAGLGPEPVANGGGDGAGHGADPRAGAAPAARPPGGRGAVRPRLLARRGRRPAARACRRSGGRRTPSPTRPPPPPRRPASRSCGAPAPGPPSGRGR